jgi:hypothetical protein
MQNDMQDPTPEQSDETITEDGNGQGNLSKEYSYAWAELKGFYGDRVMRGWEIVAYGIQPVAGDWHEPHVKFHNSLDPHAQPPVYWHQHFAIVVNRLILNKASADRVEWSIFSSAGGVDPSVDLTQSTEDHLERCASTIIAGGGVHEDA